MDLIREVQACTACTDLPLGPGPILQWKPTSRILIAGQAPGRITHQKAIPFDDPSGDRLRDWLGVTREQFYDPDRFAIVPMAFCFPGSSGKGDLPPPPRCARLWRHKLISGLVALDLTIVIGRFAADWHLGEKATPLTALASRWRETLPGLVLLPHPSPRNRPWISANPWFEQDLLRDLRARVREILTD